MVRKERLELSHQRYQNLNLARLPIPPLSQLIRLIANYKIKYQIHQYFPMHNSKRLTTPGALKMGWTMGIEPTTTRITILHSTN